MECTKPVILSSLYGVILPQKVSDSMGLHAKLYGSAMNRGVMPQSAYSGIPPYNNYTQTIITPKLLQIPK
jgi:hypothetical protein